MGKPGAVRVGAVSLLLAVLIGACGGGGSSVRSSGLSPPSSTTTTTDATAATAATDAAPPTSATPDASTPAAPSPAGDGGSPSETEASPASAPLIERVGGTDGADKVVTVVSGSWSSSTADLAMWERRGDGAWELVGGPWAADVGRGGWAYEPGESTLRSPIGSFGFGTGFGLQPDPGYAGGWFDITDTDYWVEDPASPDYNTRQQGPVDPALAPWGHFEHLADYTVAYRYAALINFNVPARGPIGSGIFLHQSTGSGSTAGCVALPEDELLTVLRWIDPASTRIVMGPESELEKL